MELNVIKPLEINLIDQLGITQSRADELAEMLNKVLAKRYTGKPESVGEMFKEIAFYCKDLQEYTFCVVSHTSYMAYVHGHIYCKPTIIKKG